MESRKNYNDFTYRGARHNPSYNEFRYREASTFPNKSSNFSSFGNHSTGFNVNSYRKSDVGSYNQYSSFTQPRQHGQNYGSSWQNASSASTSKQIYPPIDKGTEFGERNAFGHQQQLFASSHSTVLNHDNNHGRHDRYQHLSNVAENPFRASEKFDRHNFEKDQQFYQDYKRPHLRFTERSSQAPKEFDRQSSFKDQSQNYQDYASKTHSPISMESDRQIALGKFESKNFLQYDHHQPSQVHGSHSFQKSKILKRQFKIKKEKNNRKILEKKLDLLEKRPSSNQRKRAKEKLLNDPNISEDTKKQLLHGTPLEYALKFLPSVSTTSKKFKYMENQPDKRYTRIQINELLDNFIKSEKQKKSSESIISSDTPLQSKEASIQPTEFSKTKMSPVLSNQESRQHFTKEDIIKQRKNIGKRKYEKERSDIKFYKKLGIFPQSNKKKKKQNVFGKYTMMAVMKNNFPVEEFTEEEMPEIKKEIMDEIASTSDEQLPRIERIVYFCGAVLVYCKDNGTVDWLKSRIHNKPVMLPECTLKVTLATDMPRSTKIGLKTIDIVTTDPKVFLKTIDQLNPEYKATTWRFKKMHKNFFLNKCTSFLWLFDIDYDLVDVIKGKKNVVYTGVKKTTLKIYKSYFDIFDTLK